MLKLIHAPPVGGSPHSYVVSLIGSGFDGRSRLANAKSAPTKTKLKTKNTKTLANWKYITNASAALLKPICFPTNTFPLESQFDRAHHPTRRGRREAASSGEQNGWRHRVVSAIRSADS